MSDAYEAVPTQSAKKCDECGYSFNVDCSVRTVQDPSVKLAKIDTKPEL